MAARITRTLSGSVNQMRYSIRSILIAVVVCAFAALWVASEIRMRAQNASENQQMLVAFLVCEYLFENTNQWPPDWDALKPIFDSEYKKTSPWNFDDLKRDVTLRFDIDGPSLIGTAIDGKKSRLFRAIESKSGHNDYRETDPNQAILNHFRNMISY